jgi:hypothetical protein
VSEMVDAPENRIEGESMGTRTTAELLAALGSAFSATLLGVAVRDLDVMPVLGDRLLEELRKRGLPYTGSPKNLPRSLRL